MSSGHAGPHYPQYQEDFWVQGQPHLYSESLPPPQKTWKEREENTLIDMPNKDNSTIVNILIFLGVSS